MTDSSPLVSSPNTSTTATATTTTTTAPPTGTTSLIPADPTSGQTFDTDPSSDPSTATDPYPLNPTYQDSEAHSSTDSLPTSASSTNPLRRSTIANRSSPSGSRIGLSGLAAQVRDRTSNTFANLTAKPWNAAHEPGADSSNRAEHINTTGAPPGTTASTVKAAAAQPALQALHGNVIQSSTQHHTTREIPRSQPSTPSKEKRQLHSGPQSSRPQTPLSHSRGNSRTSSPTPVSSPPGSYNKMHQTSSRLLRMTDEERPFTRDFKDLFSTLMVSLPLIAHRVRFQKVEHTFTSEEAINNLGSLKFSQSNRMPDPKDPSRIVTTTTTTTFSMAREMARSVCQRFMDGRFIESADGKHATTFPLKNGVWQLTPKGMHVLSRFCQRNGITQKHVLDLLDSPRNVMQLVLLERDLATDRLSHDKATTEVIFRRFVGQDGPNTKTSTATADSDSLSDYYNGMIGVKMAKERKLFDKIVRNTFTGKAAVDWLMDCSTTVDRKEACETASQFVLDGLMYPIADDKAYITQHSKETAFQPTKSAVYALTNKGQRVAGWILREKSSSSDEEGGRGKDGKATARDSNTNRLGAILSDPALRLLFREFLRDTHCEENLAFYLDVVEFTTSYRLSVRKNANPKIDTIRETLAAAYGM